MGLTFVGAWREDLYMSKKEKYFPDPAGNFTPNESSTWIQMLKFDESIYGNVARARINNWLDSWDKTELKEILGRINGKKKSDWYGALGELYANAYMKSLGLRVTRLKSRGPNTSTPDFLVEYRGKKLYLEVTSITKDNPTFDKHWRQIQTSINKKYIPNAVLMIQHKTSDIHSPAAGKIADQIYSFANLYSADEVKSAWESHYPIRKNVSQGNWELEVHLLPRPITRSKQNIFTSIKARTALITDDVDLRNKIKKKKDEYPNLEFPLVLFVLEDAFIGGFDWHHRFNVMYGEQALSLDINSNEVTNVLKPNGFWNRKNLDTKLAGVLMMDRLDISMENLSAMQLWTNPHVDSKWLINLFLTNSVSLKGDLIKTQTSGILWDGIHKFSRSEISEFRNKIRLAIK